jgi:hypothetical protein
MHNTPSFSVFAPQQKIFFLIPLTNARNLLNILYMRMRARAARRKMKGVTVYGF